VMEGVARKMGIGISTWDDNDSIIGALELLGFAAKANSGG
jgi:hypothetical protein